MKGNEPAFTPAPTLLSAACAHDTPRPSPPSTALAHNWRAAAPPYFGARTAPNGLANEETSICSTNQPSMAGRCKAVRHTNGRAASVREAGTLDFAAEEGPTHDRARPSRFGDERRTRCSRQCPAPYMSGSRDRAVDPVRHRPEHVCWI